MLIYVLRWWPSWISDRHRKHIICRGPFKNHSWADWFQLSQRFQRRSVLKHYPQRVQCKTKSCRSRHFEFHIGTKNGGYGRTQFNIGPYGENVSKRFFSETTKTVKTKLPRNDHWKVLYKLYVFHADRKSKMAATAGHRLTLDLRENVQMPSSQKLQI